MNTVTKKIFTASALVLGMFSTSSIISIAQADDKVVRVMTFGSTWEKVLKPLSTEFKKETGIQIIPVIENSSAEGLAKIQASRANPGVDVWFTGEAIALRAATDSELFLPLPKEKIPNLAKLMDGSVQDKFVSFWYFPTGIVYRPDLVPGGKITSWQELFTPAFKNKIALPLPAVYPGRTILIASLLNGGSIDNIAPGIDFLAKQRNQVAMFHSSDTAARKALASGEIIAMMGSPSAVKELANQNIPVAMVSPKPTPLIFEGMMMVNNHNSDAAAEFINHALSNEWQAYMTKVYNLAPVNKEVPAAPELSTLLPTPENAVTVDEGKVNKNLGDWTEKFNAAISQ